jgi:hypothetical protein
VSLLSRKFVHGRILTSLGGGGSIDIHGAANGSRPLCNDLALGEIEAVVTSTVTAPGGSAMREANTGHKP